MLYTLIHGQLHSDIIAAATNYTNPLFGTVNKDEDVVGLLSILLPVCVKNLSGTKMDPHYNALQIMSFTLTYIKKKGISNNNFGDAVLDQVLATRSQYDVFVLVEIYHAKVLHGEDEGGLALANYHALD